MTTAYTSLLGLALPVTGELSGTWGDTVNNSITSLLDTSVAGTTNVSTDGDVTLTTTTGAANTARQAILLFSGARTALRTVTAPAQSKIYTVINATTGGFSVKLVGAGPTTGVTIVAGESAVCAWNGSDFVKVSNTGGSGTFTNLTVTGNTILGDASADTVTVNGTVTSNLIFTDNTYDIGASGATRPRNLFLAGTATIGSLVTSGDVRVNDTTDSTSTITGSFQTDGGVGIVKSLYVGGGQNLGGNLTFAGANPTIQMNGNAVNQAAVINNSNGGSTTITLNSAGLYFQDDNLVNFATFGKTETVFNETGRDTDFRVESDTNTHALYVDAGLSRVGINVSAPVTTLAVTTSSNTDNAFNPAIVVGPSGTGSQGGYIGSRTASANQLQGLYVQSNQTLTLWGDTAGDTGTVLEVVTGASPSASTSANALLQLYSTGSFVTIPAADGHAVFNENGVDADFRVESDANTHMLFVDAGNNRVGVATSTPATPFHVFTGADFLTIGTNDGTGSNGNYGLQFRIDNQSHVVGAVRGNYFSSAAGGRGGLIFTALNSGTAIEMLRLTGPSDGGVVFNEDSGDIDFRVESDNRTHMLFVDAGTDQVIMGQSTPRTNATLTLSYWGSSAGNNAQLSIDANANSGTGQAVVELLAGSGSSSRASRINFLNGVTSTTVPRWTLINDYDQVGINDFRLINATAWSMMEFTQSGGVVFNEGSNDLDFRVESDAQTHMLFVDAGNNCVGIGSSSPSGSGNLVVSNTDNTRYAVYMAGVTGNIAGVIGAQVTIRDTTAAAGVAGFGGLGFTSSPGTDYVIGKRWNTTSSAFVIREGGNSQDYLTITAGQEIVFNDTSNDIDFRVESDANTHMLFVDAGSNTVGINNSSPNYGLHVKNVAAAIEDTTNPVLYLIDAGNSTSEMGVSGLGSGLDNLYIAGYAGRALSQYDFRITGANGEITTRTGMVVNESGADSDFRVESDTQTHMLFVDAGLNRVGINQTTPLAALDVNDSEIRQNGITTAVRTATNSTGGGIFLSQFGDVPVTGWIHAVETGTSNYLILACYKESSASSVTTTVVASNGLGVQATNSGGTVTLNGFTTGANVKMVAYVIGTTGAD
jgi:hypothetical protein